MLVPRYWAEARIQKRLPDRQLTVRRFGWSNESQDAAQQHAESRAQEAFEKIASGRTLPQREKKVGYAGSDGLPIREEILDEFGDTVVTRNSYGARCLNTPDMFIADIDFANPHEDSCGISCLGFIASAATAAYLVHVMNWPWLVGLLTIIIGPALVVLTTGWLAALCTRLRGGHARVARRHIETFMEQHPLWHIRIYRSPNGYRLIALHQLFDPRSDECEHAFTKLQVDRTYAVMCQKQNCFRARLTAKPWRIGISHRLRPRPGVWPIKAERRPERRRWVTQYESAANDYAACRFVEAIGNVNTVDPVAQRICDYHDRLSNALTDLEIA